MLDPQCQCLHDNAIDQARKTRLFLCVNTFQPITIPVQESLANDLNASNIGR